MSFNDSLTWRQRKELDKTNFIVSKKIIKLTIPPVFEDDLFHLDIILVHIPRV